jgi:hypothetical protein
MKEIKAMYNEFYMAHSNTSFSPEKRAESCINDFSAELTADLAELGEKAGNYKAKYLEHLRKWVSRKSRCLSSMITGPANFPTERNRKAMNAERNAWEEFQAWRERYIKRANRVPTKSPEEEIDDALIRLEKERNAHSIMVEVNKIHRKKITDEEKRRLMTEELELNPETVEKMMEPDVMGRIGFASFSLTNSNARIKNLEQKLLIMKARIERRDTFEPIKFDGGSIDIENDRVVIRHEMKPSQDVIQSLKSRGFRWSPNWKCWCRKHTAQAVHDAKTICGVKYQQ